MEEFTSKSKRSIPEPGLSKRQVNILLPLRELVVDRQSLSPAEQVVFTELEVAVETVPLSVSGTNTCRVISCFKFLMEY